MKLTNTNFTLLGFRYMTTFSLCIFGSLLVSCASVSKETSAGLDKESSIAAKEAVVNTPSEDAPKEVQSAEADKLMATLKAPLIEPGSKPKSFSSKSVKQKSKRAKKAGQKKSDVVEKQLVVAPAMKKTFKKVMSKKEVSKKIVSKKAASKKSKVVKPLSINLNDLPVSYDIWTLKQGETPLTEGLVISTPTWQTGAEGYMSQIWLTLMEDKVLVHSSSDIASAAGNLGIKIDGGPLIPFTRIAESSIGVVDGQWLNKLANAKQLKIYLGFFPDKTPKSKVFKSETSLKNLDRMVLTYRNLLK